ncbi:fungal-specific transcription factor domain-containing protein [Hypoxylon trugodes]|uniref:fungal-specific transcription factor domain-containing protein n=1 Tax=Hypoxylon trugodes TaxID=326681 RepID=UPI0021A0DE6F|nr:fungal-specific transcription factor domain-containing protein [Hypoxylon trugodes]KAI1391863.1 fungal-specific transcription factor domain-containing protein [Hypoxylon trugodes]
MEDAEAPEASGPGSPGPRRACDQCRLRKIRCDKESPCSNCRSAKRSCSSTGAGQKPKEPRQRVLISSQYERKIDLIEERLGGIETLLRNLAPISASPSNTEAPTRQPSDKLTPLSMTSRDDTSSTVFDPEDAGDFEGNSSLAAHTAFASEFLEHAVQGTSLQQQGGSPKIDAALSSLRRIVHMQESRRAVSSFHEFRLPGQKQSSKTTLRDLPLPPMEFVAEKLREMKHGPVPMMLAVLYCFIDIEHFTDQCRRLYFNAGETTDATVILVNSGLAYLFFEAGLSAKTAEDKARYDTYYNMCQKNLDTVLAQLNFLMPATLENIEALLMAASFAVDTSKPSLAWLLSTRAAHMCRALGLHQVHSMKDDSPQKKSEKSLLFWCTYMLDKGLSLRLGRASVLQDYDISLPHIAPEAHAAYPGTEVMTLWIKHAQIQGRIYERLYSPGALRQPNTYRVEQVGILTSELKHLRTESMKLFAEFEASASAEGQMFAIMLKSDEVSYLSSLVLTYRALPPAPTGARSRTFSDECIDLARSTMKCHQEAMGMMDNQSLKILYIHWTILYAPFIPFIVIFCLVIETSSADDLRCLAEFVTSLEASCDVSHSISKLYQLCQVLYNIAQLYIEAKAQQPLDRDMVPIGNEFNMYLNQLGFMPIDENMANFDVDSSAGGGPLNDQARSMAQTAQLGDWFSGNNYMLGLLEEDLSSINTSGWPS